ncbi:DUF6188 family protein [Rhodococcus sp. 114MFTsu3.1]|uniref:DUF6188 family protein n=1 Tax=Rhodococcus sp. 114MFTsu3.1 TaxID=1172184 RepID=UPI0012DD5A0A|nr:DUF6188 family protein [Rhodococcus sp. 114MFTsu3.1]
MEISILGQTIESIEFGFSLVLLTIRGYEIRIESAFQVTESGRERFVDVPDESLSNNSVLGRLMSRTVGDAQASDSGDLSVSFGEGASLEVSSNPITKPGPSQVLVVSKS